ncbi:Nn.00g007290.m01.CDS01 [Neocucurbitaria sp. VM-36]
MEYSPQDHPKSLAIMDATAADANGTPTNKMLPRKKVQHILNIKDRLPSIMGWLSESNTFDILAKACLENSKRHGMKIGIIRGPDHSLTDGALVLDPPKGFPFDDPEQASKWLQNPQNNITTLRLLRFDAKLGFSKLKAWQWAPFFIVTIPEFPDYICVVPIRSYANLFNVHRRSYRYDESTRMKTLVHSRKEIVYCDFLAPFAIHEDHVYRALISLANASTNKTPYVNPTTGVEFHGWFIPDPEKNLQGVLKVRSESQETSRVAIEELNSFLNDCPGMYMTLNPVGPLICDLILVDEQQSKYYHIEHKSHTPGAGGSEHLIKRLNPAWYDEKMNWHFLLNQSGNQLAIFTRKGDTDIESNKTPLQLIDMTKPGSATVFANTIRSYGPAARTRLHKKWKKVELYDDEIEDDGKVSGRYKTTEPAVPKLDAFGKPASESQQLGLAFQVNFNDLCYQQRRHGCILLSNHPSASAAIIEHVWDANDVFLYETSGLVPVSLVTSHMTTNRCILLRFVPHRLPTAQSRPNMSQLFELALAGTIDIPLCVAQEFFYVAMTGGIPVPGQQLSLDKVALLSSSQTNILGDSKVCSNCEGHTRPRIWKSLQNRISADETTARAREWFSFTQYPVLRTGAEPLKQLYSFEDGTVHQYFSHVFLRNDTDHVMPIHGPKGILQRQWNHGDLRENAFFGEHPSDE